MGLKRRVYGKTGGTQNFVTAFRGKRPLVRPRRTRMMDDDVKMLRCSNEVVKCLKIGCSGDFCGGGSSGCV